MKTGFIHGYTKKPVKKYYKYHGEIRDCLIEPDHEPFNDYPTGGPLGPIIQKYIFSYYYKGYNKYEQDYWVAHEAGEATNFYPGIGQKYTEASEYYNIFRSGVIFDTSILPDKILIHGAILLMRPSVYVQGSRNWGVVITHSETSPHDYDLLSDYNHAQYSGNGGETDPETTNYTDIGLNPLGVSWIRTDGPTRFFLRSSRDIQGSKPPDNEFANYYGAPHLHRLLVYYREYL